MCTASALQGLQYSFGTAVGLLKSVIAFVLMIGAQQAGSEVHRQQNFLRRSVRQ